jgi:hypothetical protein
VQGLDIICVDTPSGEVAEMSSSYDFSNFSSGDDPELSRLLKFVWRFESEHQGVMA